ncbi:MAG: sulfite exporter TauE/SafE family protein [Alcanivoracaceae bacterium]
MLLLAALILIAATLYSSVGHGGASGYLAAMALMGVAPAEMKPAALCLNILVASIGSWRYLRAGFFNRPLFLRLMLASVPFAFIGGMLQLPAHWYQPLVGSVLLYAAWRFFRREPDQALVTTPPPLAIALAAGGAIGFLSGLTGVGGGIFLSPLLVLLAWSTVREASGIAAMFILVNSIAGLAGLMTQGVTLPSGLIWWAPAAVVGGLIGTELGSRRLGVPILKKLLGAVLVVAGMKMILTHL